jgi:predicted histone-like DNA-binding protein
MWYARASYDDSDKVTTNELCRQISHATTLTPTDVKACVASFLYYINENLRNGKKVKLDTFGQFKVGMKTSPADSPKDFKASSNVKGLRVIFTPASSEDSTATNRVKGLLEGVKVVEHGTYLVNKEETPEP